jgi:hypothetical protein
VPVSDLSWYYATSPKATFGFEVKDGKVVASAPYGRKWLVGMDAEKVLALLRMYGYEVKRGDAASG